MKTTISIFLISMLLIFFSCEEQKPQSKTDSNSKAILPTEKLLTKESDESTRQIAPTKAEFFYVSAPSGLNYRQSPNGKVIDKFPMNTAVKVIHHSGIFREIQDGGKTLNGEWLGIEKGKDTVYVFSEFLSTSYSFSDLQIYFASPYQKENSQTRLAFVNLSEAKKWDQTVEQAKIPEIKLGADIIQLNQKYKRQFLRSRFISASDKLFIFNLKLDSIFTYKIKDLPMIASVNIYRQGEDHLSPEDYEIGFSLGENYRAKGSNFVYIGKENIFQTGRIKAILWEEIKTEDFPVKFDPSKLDENIRTWFKEIVVGTSFKFSSANLDYYIQDLETKNKLRNRNLVILDAKTGKEVFQKLFTDTESTELIPLSIKNKELGFEPQWTGEIFKNKPPIAYGFMGNSFGCPIIDFLSKGEPPILSLCDNRH